MVEAALLQSHNLTELDGFETFQQGTVDLQLQGIVEFYYIIIRKGKDTNFKEFPLKWVVTRSHGVLCKTL